MTIFGNDDFFPVLTGNRWTLRFLLNYVERRLAVRKNFKERTEYLMHFDGSLPLKTEQGERRGSERKDKIHEQEDGDKGNIEIDASLF